VEIELAEGVVHNKATSRQKLKEFTCCNNRWWALGGRPGHDGGKRKGVDTYAEHCRRGNKGEKSLGETRSREIGERRLGKWTGWDIQKSRENLGQSEMGGGWEKRVHCTEEKRIQVVVYLGVEPKLKIWRSEVRRTPGGTRRSTAARNKRWTYNEVYSNGWMGARVSSDTYLERREKTNLVLGDCQLQEGWTASISQGKSKIRDGPKEGGRASREIERQWK